MAFKFDLHMANPDATKLHNMRHLQPAVSSARGLSLCMTEVVMSTSNGMLSWFQERSQQC